MNNLETNDPPEKSNPRINREMTWTTGPTEPGGPLPGMPAPPAPASPLARFLPLAHFVLDAIRAFPGAYRAVYQALDTVLPLGDRPPESPLSFAPA